MTRRIMGVLALLDYYLKGPAYGACGANVFALSTPSIAGVAFFFSYYGDNVINQYQYFTLAYANT
jgi:hypothetical protein